MKPQEIEIVELGQDRLRVTATFGAQDMSGVFRMVNRMLAYRYEVDSKSDDDIPQLLSEKMGDERLDEDRAQAVPLLLAPFVVDALDFETIFEPVPVGASDLMVGSPYTIAIEVTRKPVYELTSYESVTVSLPKARFDDEELAGFMAAVADEYADYAPVSDGSPVRAGDRVVFDIETFGDYGSVPSLCGKGFTATAGEGWLAPEFDENVIGASAGSKKRFTIHALTEASSDENDTEKLNVTVLLKEVLRPEAFDITDEWVAGHIEGASTVREFEALIQDNMITGSAHPESREVLLAKTAEALAARLDIGISDELYQHVVNEMLAQMEQGATSEGKSFEEYLDALGLTMETLGEYLMARARSQIMQGFALDAYYRHFGLSIDEDDIDRALSHMAGSDRLDAVDSLKHQFELAGKMYVIREQARRLKANTVALDAATIVYE